MEGITLFQKIKETNPKRYGFFLIAVLLFWLKTYLAYQLEFSLGVDGFYQQLLLFINPLASTLLIFGISLLFSDAKKGYRALLVLYALNTLLLFSNILYYREFTDFITIKTILSAFSLSGGIGTSATRAEIIKKLERIVYIEVNKKTQILTPSKKGEVIYDVVRKTMPDMLNPKLTASWEKGLTMVAQNEIKSDEFMEKLDDYIRTKVVKYKKERNEYLYGF